MLRALSTWITNRQRIARAQDDYYAFADELLQLEEHIGADPTTRERLAYRVLECRRGMDAAAEVAFCRSRPTGETHAPITVRS